jgi:hypothetical protein
MIQQCYVAIHAIGCMISALCVTCACILTIATHMTAVSQPSRLSCCLHCAHKQVLMLLQLLVRLSSNLCMEELRLKQATAMLLMRRTCNL